MTGRRGLPAGISALIRSSHLVPCLAITAMTVLLAVGAGATGARLIPFAISVLAGQLSIGWSNDAFDAELDRSAGRTDKPVAAGTISRRAVATAAGMSLVLSMVLAFALGPSTGLLSVVVVGAGWAYNAGAKGSIASGLAYLLGFGPIPALATSILPGHPLPRPWTVAAASLLGLGAHFANVLPDLAGDQAGGVRGLPQRVAEAAGPLAVRLVAVVLLLSASVLIALVPGGGHRWLEIAGLAAAAGLSVVAVRASGRTPFRCAMLIAGIGVIMLLFSGADLV